METHTDLYTCRPVSEKSSLEAYQDMISRMFTNGILTYYLENEDGLILGKINFFDYNPRNQSGEFGYYFPREHRSKGYGSIFLELFITEIFDTIELNKIYATTASNNMGSIKILEKCNFHLDGRLREHYWIGQERFDQLHYSLTRSDMKGQRKRY